MRDFVTKKKKNHSTQARSAICTVHKWRTLKYYWCRDFSIPWLLLFWPTSIPFMLLLCIYHLNTRFLEESHNGCFSVQKMLPCSERCMVWVPIFIYFLLFYETKSHAVPNVCKSLSCNFLVNIDTIIVFINIVIFSDFILILVFSNLFLYFSFHF